MMAVGQLLVHFLEALCSKLDEVLRACVPFVLDGARTGIRPGFAGFPNVEKLYALLEPWEHVEDGACLDGTHCAGGLVAQMRELVRHLHRTYHHWLPPHCRGPASCFREHITQKSGKDSINVLASLQPHLMAMMSQDIVESMNRIPKVGYNDHSDRGGGCAEHTTLRETCVVAQLWECKFLQFDLPLQPRGVPHKTSYVVRTLREPVVQTLAPINMPHSPPPPFFF